MLEDDFTYVIRKAFKGLALSPSEAAKRASLPEKDVLSFSRGTFSASIARQLAPVLGLRAEPLAGHPDFHPAPLACNAVTRIKLPFDGEHVNAWLVRDAGTAILFDTGNEPKSCPARLADLGIDELDALFITHGHRDHIAALQPLSAPAIASHGPRGISGTELAEPGSTFDFGSVRIHTLDLSGHADPSNGYLIEGLEKPVLVTGDALFSGSIGGCPDPRAYQCAMERLREVLSNLPPGTILLPGHGPATTLAEERHGNPFDIFSA